jgi:CheY-like chemotaxis protein
MAGVGHRVRPVPGTRVLVVEDDDDIRDGVVTCLTMEGMEVSSARSGNAGFERFQSVRPDVLVSDLGMPDGDGFALVERIRTMPPEEGGLTPAIAISASENMGRALMAGYHAFLAKPFGGDLLIATIADFAKHGDGDGQPVAPWTIRVTSPGQLTIALAGRVESGDMRSMTKALLVHLEGGPVEITSDLRLLTSFAPSVGSIAERALWARRGQIAKVTIVGGSTLARLVSTAACKILGLDYSLDTDR